LTLTGAVSGAADLTLQTNALSGGTSIAGTGVLTIAPIDPTLVDRRGRRVPVPCRCRKRCSTVPLDSPGT
jgi:hypothetical protein